MVTYETASFKMRIGDDGLKELTVKENATYDASDVEESLELSLRGNYRSKFYVLFEAEGNANITEDARKRAASQDYTKYTAALALCSDKPTLVALGNIFLTVNRPKVPTKFFKKRADALRWLKEKMAA